MHRNGPVESVLVGRDEEQGASKPVPSREAEQQLWSLGLQRVAGVDEAGRGPLAGPVVAAACVVAADAKLTGVRDSKAFSSDTAREGVYQQLVCHPGVEFSVSVLDHEDIDRMNILQAALAAMKAAVDTLPRGSPQGVLVDGNHLPAGLDPATSRCVVRGDTTSTAIAAASIIAKVQLDMSRSPLQFCGCFVAPTGSAQCVAVALWLMQPKAAGMLQVTRDRLMVEFDKQYPVYGFARHKGYGTAAHREAIRQHGPCPIHRRSFEPVKSMILADGQKASSGAHDSPDENRSNNLIALQDG